VLLYKGDNEHIAVELYRGRLRVSYDSGSYPPSAIYRYIYVLDTIFYNSTGKNSKFRVIYQYISLYLLQTPYTIQKFEISQIFFKDILLLFSEDAFNL